MYGNRGGITKKQDWYILDMLYVHEAYRRQLVDRNLVYQVKGFSIANGLTGKS